MRTVNFTTLITFLFISLFALTSNAQDIHFSHIHASPTFLNPAMTGLFNGDVRIMGNYRSQWQSVTKGYRTMAAGVDMKMINLGKDIIAGGFQFYSDKAGDLDFSTNAANLAISYLKSLDGRGRSFISFGFQNALISNSVDYTKIIAFEEEPGVLSGAPDRINYWDFSAGVAYYNAFGKDNFFHIGASVFHLNKPFVSFFEREDPTSAIVLYRRLALNGGASFQLNKRSALKPTFIFMDQGPHREITIGSFYKYEGIGGRTLRGATGSSLYFGAWVRWYAETDIAGTDAIIAAVRWDYNKMFITFSFDINISTLSRVSTGQGGPELSIVKILDSRKRGKRRTKVECPDL